MSQKHAKMGQFYYIAEGVQNKMEWVQLGLFRASYKPQVDEYQLPKRCRKLPNKWLHWPLKKYTAGWVGTLVWPLKSANKFCQIISEILVKNPKNSERVLANSTNHSRPKISAFSSHWLLDNSVVWSTKTSPKLGANSLTFDCQNP